jgi:hypothetical protein
MNIAESIRIVFRKKRERLFTKLLKQQLKSMVQDTPGTFRQLSGLGKQALKEFSIRETLGDAKSMLVDTAFLIKVMPQRINEGYKKFSADFFQELEQREEQKEKALFAFKVLACLGRFALSSAYDVGFGDVKFLSLAKGKVTFSRMIVAKLVLKTMRAFVLNLLEEMEQVVDQPEEQKRIQSMKKILSDDKSNAVDKLFDGVIDPTDRAFIMVEEFKRYVLYGDEILKEQV